jgi:hypothetical protein
MLINGVKRVIARPTSTIFWSNRTVYPEGFVSAVLSSSDGAPVNSAQYQYNYYFTVLHNIADHLNEAKRSKQDFITAIRELRANGWRVMFVRLPISDEMLQLENTMPPELQFEALVTALGVPFVDYTKRMTKLETADGSHLTPQSARRFAPILTSDILKLQYRNDP